MKVWLLTIGEPVPVGDGISDRLHRTGLFGRYLASRGHSVVWWTSTFDHFRKKHLISQDSSVTDPSGLKLRLLHGRGYRRNISISRFADHREVARKFRALSEGEPRPDILVTALPTVEMCLEAQRYARRNGIPTVVDLRDMWPDVIAEAVPGPVRAIARVFMSPLYRQCRQACASASSLIGITDAFVDWGLSRAGRSRQELDRAFPFAYDPQSIAPEDLQAAETFWNGHGITAGSPDLVVCYFGNIGQQIDLGHVLGAAQRLQDMQVPIRLVLCGDGELLEEYRRNAVGLSNVVLPGWVNRAQIQVLMRRSALGLDPLRERFDFLATINNKAVEYMSAGLPVLSSPNYGTLCDLIKEADCGLSYPSGDADALAARLQDLASRRDECHRMGANSLALFHQRFAPDIVYSAMEAHLETVCTSASK